MGRRKSGKAGRRALWPGIVAAFTLLAGCAPPDPDAPFATYLARLGHTLDVTANPPAPAALPRPPHSGALQLAIPRDSLDLIDFLALSGCELQVTIGKRNSSLGRLARPSQRLLLDLEFLRLAPACVDHLRAAGRDTLAESLLRAQDHRRANLPALIFNATLGSDEYRAFWRTSAAPGGYPPVAGTVAVDALAAINADVRRWLAGDYTADNTGFEIRLGEVAGGGGGSLLRALEQQRAWLASADALLAAAAGRGPLCAAAFRDAAADILPNVVQKYFVGAIQPDSAQLQRRWYALEEAVRALEAQLNAVLPAAYRDWMQARDALLADTTAAPRRHVAGVQALLAPCAQGRG